MDGSGKKFGISTNLVQTILVIALIVAAYFIGNLSAKVQLLGGAKQGTTVPSDAAAPAAAVEVPAITKDDHVRGDRNARYALIEYSDLECPYCKTFHPTAQQAIKEYGGKLQWVYRHFPLSFHANAQKEAEAAECANEVGGNDAFWKYINAIYARTTSNGTGFALDKLVPLAGELGLDQAAFKKCFGSGKYAAKITAEMNAGSAAGITGTPGNILLDTKTGTQRVVPGAVPYEQLKSAVDELMKG